MSSTNPPSTFNPYASPREAGAANIYGPPTHARYVVLLFGVSMSLLLYLHRFAISIVQPIMGQANELNLDPQQLGYVQSAFFYTYALAQVPAGWLSQKLGSRLALTGFVLLWSIAFGLLGFATGLVSLIIFRGLLGLAQAGAYPCVVGILKRWIPITGRGFANSFTAMGGRSGSLVATALTPFVMIFVARLSGWETGNWRLVFWIYCSLGIVWATAFWLWFRNSPAEHAACNDAERSLIAGTFALPKTPAETPVTSTTATAPAAAPRAYQNPHAFYSPRLALLTIFITCLVNIFVNVGWIFLVTFLPTFLTKRFELEPQWIGLLAATPILASMCGGVLGGVATDAFVKRFGLKWGRRLTGIISNGMAATMYLLSLRAEGFLQFVLLFAAVGFFIDFGLGSLWAVYQDIAGRYVSMVLGFANMCGNLAAAVFASIIGGYAKQAEWSTVFAISCAALFVTMLCWFVVNPNAKLTADD